MNPVYSSNITETQWSLISPIFEKGKKGRPRKHHPLSMLNAVLYVARTGCQWRNLPHDFPPWKSVFSSFRRWSQQGKFEQMATLLREQLNPKDDIAVIDSRCVRSSNELLKKTKVLMAISA